jgi:hypothetical protein
MLQFYRKAAVIAIAFSSLLFYAGCGKNNPPTINGLIFPDSVGTDDTAAIICQAVDPDGDGLQFQWTALNGGSFTGVLSDTAHWVAPAQVNTYSIMVQVNDGINTAVDTTVSIRVTQPFIHQPPQPVTLEQPANITTSALDLVWSQSPDSNFARYEVHRSTQAYFTPADSTKIRVMLAAIDTTYTVTGLSAGNTYYFKVVVANTDGLSAASNEVNASTQYFLKIGSVQLPGRPLGLDISGDLALIADREGGLQVVTISNPQSPMKIGSYELTGYARAYDVFAQRPYAFVAFGDSGFHVVDFSNPSTPVLRAAIDTIQSAYTVFAYGPYAYISSGDKLFRVVDIHDPVKPVLMGSCVLPDTVADIFVSGTYAFAACGNSGMEVVDVSTQDDPNEIMGVTTVDKTSKLYVSGGYAYLATSFAGLEIIDITRPTNPVAVASLKLPGEAYDVYVSGNYAYVACWDKGLQVVDVRDPRNPVLRYSMDLPGCFINGVVVSGKYIYLTDWNYGFIVLSY